MNSDQPEFQETAPPAPLGQGRRRLRDVQENRARRRRYLQMALSVALFVLLINSIVGENGYLATLRARSEQNALEAQVAALRFDNQHLQQESRRLLSDPTALEETARGTLGFIRPGETLIVLHDPAPASGTTAAQPMPGSAPSTSSK